MEGSQGRKRGWGIWEKIAWDIFWGIGSFFSGALSHAPNFFGGLH